MHRYPILVILLLFGSIGCSPALDVRVETEPNPQVVLQDLRRFALVQSHERDVAAFDLTEHAKAQISKDVGGILSTSDGRYLLENADSNPAMARYIASLSRDTLVERGLRFDEADPQFTLSVDFVDGQYREYGHTGVRGIIGVTSDESREVRVGGAGGEIDPYPPDGPRTFYVRAVAVYLYDAADPDRLLWQGRVVTTRTTVEMSTLLPMLIDELLGEFPFPSGKPAGRTIKPADQ
jgi:hypothetical protein